MLEQYTKSYIYDQVKKICEDLIKVKIDKNNNLINEIGIINDFLNDQFKYNNTDFNQINFDNIFTKYPEFNITKILDYNFCKSIIDGDK